MLGTIVTMCVSNFTTQAQADEVRAFFKGRETVGFDRALAQSLDSVQAKIAWVERDTKDVKEWLKTRKGAKL